MNRPKFDFNQEVFGVDFLNKKIRRFRVKAIRLFSGGFEYSGEDNDIMNEIIPEDILSADRETAIKLGIDELISSLEDDAVAETTDNRSDGGC